MSIKTLSQKVWFDGKIMNLADTRIHYLLTPFLCSGVFEGIRCYSTLKGPAIFRIEDHIHHLFHSAKVMGMIPPYSEHDIVLQ